MGRAQTHHCAPETRHPSTCTPGPSPVPPEPRLPPAVFGATPPSEERSRLITAGPLLLHPICSEHGVICDAATAALRAE